MAIDRITITIEKELLKKVDSLIENGKAKSRSHAIELIMNSYFKGKIYSAVILCGGDKPHFLKKIHGKELIVHLIEFLKKENISKIYLTINSSNIDYARELIDENGVKIIEESERLGTGGAILKLKEELKETFLIVYGDVYFELDLNDFFRFHRINNGIMTMALSSVKEPGKYGVVNMSGSKISEFVEKPRVATSYLINAGIHLVEPEIFSYFPSKKKVSLEFDIFPAIAKDSKLFGYLIQKWMDIGKL